MSYEQVAMLKNDFSSEMPSDIGDLTKLPGVGRKTANVVRAHIFDIPCVIVDTHVGRVSRRLGLSKETDPEKVEYDLMKLLPGEYWIKANLQMIAHGRKVCKAQKPLCGECFLGRICEYDLRHLLDKGMSSMKTGNGRPAKEVFDNIKKEYGFDKK